MKAVIHRRTQPRHEPKFEPRHFDPYLDAGKPSGDAWCPDCGVAFRDGRWSWAAVRKGAEPTPCPACLRIRDSFPGGYVTLRGDFVTAHRDELHRMVQAREAHEKAEHPLERLMAVHDSPHAIEISTTGNHLARAIGHAVQEAFEGRLDMRYRPDENLVCAVWTR